MTKRVCTRIFKNLSELATAASDDRPRRDTMTTQERYDFFGGLSFDGAIELAHAGGYWEEGTRKMQKAEAELPSQEFAQRRKARASVMGSRPNIPRYNAGSPRHMMKLEKQDSQKRVIRLGVNIGISSRMEQHHAVNRGAAILSIVRDIEAKGDQVEVTALMRVKAGHGEARGDEISVEVVVKPANAFFSAADIAFPLCHAAFLRRITCAVMEREPAAKGIVDANYGNGSDVDLSDFDCWSGYLTSPRDYETPEKALQTVKREIEQQLKQHDKAA